MRMFGAILILLSFSLPSHATDFEAALFASIIQKAQSNEQAFSIQTIYKNYADAAMKIEFSAIHNPDHPLKFTMLYDLKDVTKQSKINKEEKGRQVKASIEYKPRRKLSKGFHLFLVSGQVGDKSAGKAYLYSFQPEMNYFGNTTKEEMREKFKKLQKNCEKARNKNCYFTLNVEQAGNNRNVTGYMHGRYKIFSEEKTQIVAAEIPKMKVNGKDAYNWTEYMPPRGPTDKMKMPYSAYMFNHLPFGELFEQYSWNKYIVKGDKVCFYGGLNAQEKGKPINIELVIDEKNWRVVSGRFFLMDGVYCECDFEVEYNKEGLASRQIIEKWTTDGIYEKAVINFTDYRDEGFKFRIPGFNI